MEILHHQLTKIPSAYYYVNLFEKTHQQLTSYSYNQGVSNYFQVLHTLLEVFEILKYEVKKWAIQ